jgi:hypothetical protein
MTIQVDPAVGEAVAIAAFAGVLLAMALIGLIVWLMVRPPRHVREAKRRPPAESGEAIDAERMLAALDRLEHRLGTIERAVRADDVNIRARIPVPNKSKGREE